MPVPMPHSNLVMDTRTQAEKDWYDKYGYAASDLQGRLKNNIPVDYSSGWYKNVTGPNNSPLSLSSLPAPPPGSTYGNWWNQLLGGAATPGPIGATAGQPLKTNAPKTGSFGNPYGNLPSFPSNTQTNMATGTTSGTPSFGNPYGNLPSFNTGASTPQTLPGQAVQQNLSTAPDLTSLTNLVNQLNLQGQQTANLGRIPGEAGLEAQSSGNIASLLGGNIPQDVVTQLQQRAAERGVAMGSPGSDASNSALLRSLGLTSLDLQGLGQNELSAATARNPVAPIFDPSKMFLTPAQLGELQTQNAFLGLDWYKALTGQGGLGGGSRGGNQNFGGAPIPGGMGDTGDQTGSNWFSNLMGGTPSSSSVTPGSISVPGYPSQLDTISNPVLDYSSGGGAGLESYDPFQQYSDQSFYNTATGG